jgi:hypothetical protein
MNEQKITQRKDSNKSITQKQLSEDSAEQISSSQLPLDPLQRIPPELPNLTNTLAYCGQLVQQGQARLGYSDVARRMLLAGTMANPALRHAPPDFLQRDEEDDQAGEGSSGTTAAAAGAGAIQMVRKNSMMYQGPL